MDGTKVGVKHMTILQAHCHMEDLDLGVMSSPKRFERDTGAAVNTFPLNFGPDGAREKRFFRTASCVSVFLTVELGSFSGIRRKRFALISERKTRGGTHTHKKCCAVLQVSHAKGRQDFHLRSDGGFVIPVHSNIGNEMRMHFERLASWYGRKQLIPFFSRTTLSIFYLNREVKSTETNNVNNAQQSGNEYGRAVRS